MSVNLPLPVSGRMACRTTQPPRPAVSSGQRFGAPSGRGRDLVLLGEAQLLPRVPELDLDAGLARLVERVEVVVDHVRGLARRASRERLSGRGFGAVVGVPGDVQAEVGEHRAVLLGRVAERGQEVAHHDAVEAGLDGERLQVADVLDAAAAEPEERLRAGSGGRSRSTSRPPTDPCSRGRRTSCRGAGSAG